MGCASELYQYGLYFLPRKDRWEAPSILGAFDLPQPREILFEHVAVQEEQGIEGNVLGGGSDVLINCQVSETGADLRGPHLLGVALPMKQNKAPDPGDVRVFCSQAHMFESQDDPHLVDYFCL